MALAISHLLMSIAHEPTKISKLVCLCFYVISLWSSKHASLFFLTEFRFIRYFGHTLAILQTTQCGKIYYINCYKFGHSVFLAWLNVQQRGIKERERIRERHREIKKEKGRDRNIERRRYNIDNEIMSEKNRKRNRHWSKRRGRETYTDRYRQIQTDTDIQRNWEALWHNIARKKDIWTGRQTDIQID